MPGRKNCRDSALCLPGIFSDTQRRMSTDTQPVRIFIAYSSKDLSFKDEIRRRLRPLLRAGKISIWDNYDIEAGADWDADIREKLGQVDLILLLLSPDALDPTTSTT